MNRTNLKRLVLAIAFVVSQSLALGHASVYGAEKHSHDGKICEIVVYCKDLDDLVEANSFHEDLGQHYESLIKELSTVFLERNSSPFSARAPPLGSY